MIIQFPLYFYYPIRIALCHSIVCYFLHIKYHAVEHPLNIDLDFAPESKVVQSLLSSDIGKDRLHNSHALRIYIATLITIDLFMHGLGIIILFSTDGYIQ